MSYEVRFSQYTPSGPKGQHDLDFWVRRMEPFFSPVTGIINYYYVMEVMPQDPQLFFSSARLHRMSRNVGIPFDPSVGGVGETAEQAFLSACGEALERYASSVVPVRGLVFGSYDEMVGRGERALDPCLFEMFAPWQYEQKGFAYDPFDRASRVRWVKGKFLRSGEDVWVPAGFVYMPYAYEYGEEARINHTTSTGLAFHYDPFSALKTGLCEVVERDAFTITWWAGLCPDELDLDSVDDRRVRCLLDDKLSLWKDRIRVFCLSTDTRFPVFLGLLEERGECASRSNVPALCVGAASALDVPTALYKVIVEVVQTWKFASYLKEQNERKENKRVFQGQWDKEIRDFTDGVLCYSYPEFRGQLDFLKGGRRVNFAEMCQNSGFNSMGEALEDLHGLGFEPVVVDITPEDIRSAGGYASRVVVPGMVALNGAHRYRFWGGKRLFSLPKKLGLRAHVLTIDELNPYPHPFP